MSAAGVIWSPCVLRQVSGDMPVSPDVWQCGPTRRHRTIVDGARLPSRVPRREARHLAAANAVWYCEICRRHLFERLQRD